MSDWNIFKEIIADERSKQCILKVLCRLNSLPLKILRTCIGRSSAWISLTSFMILMRSLGKNFKKKRGKLFNDLNVWKGIWETMILIVSQSCTTSKKITIESKNKIYIRAHEIESCNRSASLWDLNSHKSKTLSIHQKKQERWVQWSTCWARWWSCSTSTWNWQKEYHQTWSN